MRSAIFKKASQDEQKNQTTTTNINYNQTYNNFYFTRKDMVPTHN